jgi:hypothetical protein
MKKNATQPQINLIEIVNGKRKFVETTIVQRQIFHLILMINVISLLMAALQQEQDVLTLLYLLVHNSNIFVIYLKDLMDFVILIRIQQIAKLNFVILHLNIYQLIKIVNNIKLDV